jgi:hypothetical protein
VKAVVVIEVLAMFTALTGFYAAHLWLRSSKIPILPTWFLTGGIEPAGGDSQSNSGWIAGIIEANETVARLNRRAALWTAASVAIGAFTTIIGVALPYVPGFGPGT